MWRSVTIPVTVTIAFLAGSHAAFAQDSRSGKGGQDPFGPYEPAPDWPKDISTLLGNEGWTWGAIQGIFAESSDRIFVIQRGVLKKIDRPANRLIEDQGTRLRFCLFMQAYLEPLNRFHPCHTLWGLMPFPLPLFQTVGMITLIISPLISGVLQATNKRCSKGFRRWGSPLTISSFFRKD